MDKSDQTFFLDIVAYYIDSQWKLQEQLIGFEELTSNHIGEAMANII